MAPVAGPSNPRKRAQRDDNNASVTSTKSSASRNGVETSFGQLELGEGEEGSVDEDYESSEDDSDAFPEIDEGSDDDDDDASQDDEDDGDLSEEEQILRELAEEEELERELQDTSDSSFSDGDDDDDAVGGDGEKRPVPIDDDPGALNHAIRKATSKPDETYDGTVAQDGLLTDVTERNKIMGFDTRNFRDKALVGQSAITGEDRMTWQEIQPGWESDEGPEEGPVRVGNIPAYFYDGMPHVGYTMEGKKVMRPLKGDELDKFLASVEDPSSWTSVEDKQLQTSVQLTDAELDLIGRIARAENPDASFDPYEPTIEWFTGKGKEMQTPLTAAPEPKRRFIPSKWEHKKVMKIVRAIRQGRILPHGPKAPEKPDYYAIWSNEDEGLNQQHPMHMPAPKMKLPGNEESYNPPAEYLFTKAEREEWENTDPVDRKLDFVPQKFDSLRRVPGYHNFVQERFERCLDLYLAPRSKKRKPKILEGVTKPEDLLPKLPDPKELRPFPTFCSVVYEHPNNVRVRCISVDPSGSWVLTGADDGLLRLWECRRGKCLATWKLDSGPVHSVAWSPNKDRVLFAAVTDGKLSIGTPMDLLAPSDGSELLQYAHAAFSMTSGDLPAAVEGTKWQRPPSASVAEQKGILLEVSVPGTPKQVTWHRRGDYLATVSPDAGAKAVLIHQITKHSTQAPFRKLKGQAQKVAFHPTRPQLILATERLVRIYDLMAQTLVKQLLPNVRHVSSVDIHPMGDNVIVGSYDRRLVWHDLDLSDRPYKTLRYHPRAIRAVAFSTRFPLFLSTSDDGTIQVFHATVYSDLVLNPLIVPLKVLRGHEVTEGLGVLDAVFHPKEPWVISAGADGTARLWM